MPTQRLRSACRRGPVRSRRRTCIPSVAVDEAHSPASLPALQDAWLLHQGALRCVCDRGISSVSFTRRAESGAWCSRECRDGKEARTMGNCRGCGAVLEGKRRGAKWCGENCRKSIPRSVQNSPNNTELAAHSKGLSGVKMPIGCRFSRRAVFVDSALRDSEPEKTAQASK